MKLRTVLEDPLFDSARIVAGGDVGDVDVHWVHVVTEPEPDPWIKEGLLVLTTGQGFSRAEAEQRRFVRLLAARRIAGLVLAVPDYFSAFPAAMLEEAERCGLALMEIAWEVPFVEITESLHAQILDEQYREIRTSAEVHRQLSQAAVEFTGLQDLAETLGRLIQRAVLIESVSGSVLGYHRMPDSEDELRARTLRIGQSTDEYERYLEDIGMLSELHASTRPVRVPASPDGAIAARIWCPVRLLNELVGMVLIIEGDRPLTEVDMRASEQASTIAALYISHQRELAAREEDLGASLLDALLELDGPMPASLEERAAIMGLAAPGWRVGMIRMPVEPPLSDSDLKRRSIIAGNLRDWLGREGRTSLTSLHLNLVVFLAPAEVDFARLYARLSIEDCQLLLSGVAAELRDVAACHAHCLTLLRHARRPGVHRYDELLVPRALAGEKLAQDELIAETFGRVASARGGAQLEETLIALAACGFHLANTAARLGIHITTLRYRIQRIEELTGKDLGGVQERFLVQLALALRTSHSALA